MKYALLSLLCLLLAACAVSQIGPDDYQLYLFRHAEKLSDGGSDPSLTAAGQRRAERLAEYLETKNIEAIYSSNYRRTRETVAPLAEQLNLTVELYDPQDLQSLALRLRSEKRNAAVAGHSNTTPQLARLLSGQAAAAMDESEYGRLYRISIGESDTEVSVLNQDKNPE